MRWVKKKRSILLNIYTHTRTGSTLQVGALEVEYFIPRPVLIYQQSPNPRTSTTLSPKRHKSALPRLFPNVLRLDVDPTWQIISMIAFPTD